MAGLSRNGNLVNVNDQVTIMGSAVSITGTAPSKAAVVVAEAYDGNQFTAQANDCSVVEPAPNTTNTAFWGGNGFAAGALVNVNGKVTSISGTGLSAQLTVTLDVSGLSITASAGSCNSNAA